MLVNRDAPGTGMAYGERLYANNLLSFVHGNMGCVVYDL